MGGNSGLSPQIQTLADTDRQMHRQTGAQTDRCTDRQVHRQTFRNTGMSPPDSLQRYRLMKTLAGTDAPNDRLRNIGPAAQMK